MNGTTDTRKVKILRRKRIRQIAPTTTLWRYLYVELLHTTRRWSWYSPFDYFDTEPEARVRLTFPPTRKFEFGARGLLLYNKVTEKNHMISIYKLLIINTLYLWLPQPISKVYHWKNFLCYEGASEWTDYIGKQPYIERVSWVKEK